MTISKFYSALILIIASITTGISAATFPANQIEQCTYGDGVCLARTINNVIRLFPNGVRAMNLLPIDPLPIDKMDIVQGGNSPVNIILNFKRAKFSGTSGATVTSVKGFDREISGKKIEIVAKFPTASLYGDYKIGGRVLVLPIQGQGQANLTLTNFDFAIRFLPKLVTRDEKQYLTMEKAKSNIINPARLSMNFENLFNGDRALGDNMNLFLNENWKEIFAELKPVVEDTFAEIIRHVVNNVFNTFPYDSLFKEQ